MYSPDAKFEEHSFNISRDILDCCTVLVKPAMTSSLYSQKMYFLMDCVLRYCSFHVQGVYTCVCAFLVASH